MEAKYLVCVNDNWCHKGHILGPMPKMGEIYTFDGHFDFEFIHLKEFTWVELYRVSFHEECFRPIDFQFGIETCERIESLIPETQNA